MRLRTARGNDANACGFNLDVHDVQQPRIQVEADGGITSLAFSLSIREDQVRIAEHGRRFLEAHAVLTPVPLGLIPVPYE